MYFCDQFFALLSALGQFWEKLLLKIWSFEMLRPNIDNFFFKGFKIEDESKKHMHLDHILTENNFFELSERQLIEPKANEIGKDRKQSGIIFSVGHGGMEIKDDVIGGFEEPFVPFCAIKDLLEEDFFGVFAFKRSKEVSSMRIGGHYVFVEGVDKLDAFGDKLVVFHWNGLQNLYCNCSCYCILILINFFLITCLTD